jgi:ParB family chromosome partitioning protein
VHQLDREHRPAPADVPDGGDLLGQRPQAAGHGLLDPLCGGIQVLLLHRRNRSERGGTGNRVAAVRPAQAARVGRVHHLGSAYHPRERQAAGHALGDRDEVRYDALVLAGEPCAGAAHPGLDLVGDEDDPVVGAPL